MARLKLFFGNRVTGAGVSVAPGVGAVATLGYAPIIGQPITVAPGVGAALVAGTVPTIGQPITVAPGVGATVTLGYEITISQTVAVVPVTGTVMAAGTVPTISQPHTLTVGSVDTLIARPDSDTTAGGWASTGASLFGVLDEAVADDGDYIANTTTNECRIELGNIAHPAGHTGHVLRYRAWAPAGGGAGWLFVYLYQGDAIIAGDFKVAVIPATPTTFSRVLTEAEVAAITDYNDLNIRFVTSIGTTRVSWVEFSVEQATQVVQLGYAPVVTQGLPVTVAPGIGAVLVAGTVPTIGQPYTLVTVTGGYAVLGAAPTITQAATINPLVGSYTALGYAPVLVQGVGASPSTGEVVVGGYTPTIGQPRTITTVTGAYEILGTAPTVTQAAFLTPADGAIVVEGYIPALGQPRTITTAVGSAVWAGFMPAIGSPVEYAKYLAGVRVYHTTDDVVVKHTQTDTRVTQTTSSVRV